MDSAEPVARRAEIHGSHESLAASSPSTSMHLGTGAGQQSRPGAFAHQGRGQEGFPKQARAEGLAGRKEGGAYVDPDDVEVNLQGQDSAWGEENDILSYVQSKVRMLHQLFPIPKGLFQFRNVIPTLGIKTQKRLGTVKTPFYIVEMF